MTIDSIFSATDLASLLAAIIACEEAADASFLDQLPDLPPLPTYGGAEPTSAGLWGLWSYDATSILQTDDEGAWSIVPRAAWDAEVTS